MANMDDAFSNMAAIKFENILNQIRSSSLNFQMSVTPFTAVIHLKKSITKDKSGNFLNQNTFVNRTTNDIEVDEIMAKNLALEQEIADLKRACFKASDSITEIERTLELINQHGNVNDENYSKDDEDNEDRNEIESEEEDENENGEEDEEKEINPTTKKDGMVDYASTSTPLTKKTINFDSRISMCDSGVDLKSCVLTPVKEDRCKKIISCNQCKEVFDNKNDLDVHKREQHNTSLEFSCDTCSKTFVKEEDKEKHEFLYEYDCKECGICFNSQDNYCLHLLNVHQDELESTEYGLMCTIYIPESIEKRFTNGERCPCAICTKARFKLETKDLTIT